MASDALLCPAPSPDFGALAARAPFRHLREYQLRLIQDAAFQAFSIAVQQPMSDATIDAIAKTARVYMQVHELRARIRGCGWAQRGGAGGGAVKRARGRADAGDVVELSALVDVTPAPSPDAAAVAVSVTPGDDASESGPAPGDAVS